MNKWFFSLLLLPLAAWADVNIYGNIKSGVEVSQTKFGGQTVSDTQVSDLGSYVGLRGSYPIGGGNSVMWQLEQDAPVGKRSDSIREQWKARKAGGENFIGIGQ